MFQSGEKLLHNSSISKYLRKIATRYECNLPPPESMIKKKIGVGASICNPITEEVEIGEFLGSLISLSKKNYRVTSQLKT